ncbi:MAG: UDP-3-O-(3-hydroxymyristoyl)glucosamine N-acyltransferase [Gammaproteobacteria bacterium]|jgi:UDP-3-O-[3-hydroxymyristoyl] glucosamine N-acyltransferase|nr:UDP-3-O-(3-hydroxymyristoyl)glucosamine N-acyltransferase [Gammaproteobacteria bacterium]
MPISLGELATTFGCELIGDPDVTVNGVASLTNASSESLTFLSSAAYSSQLPSTKAAAVVLRAADADACPVSALISDSPYVMYARMAALVCPAPTFAPGVHATATIAESARVADSAHVAASAVIGDRTTIGENAVVGPGTVIGPDCTIGDNCRFIANVSIVKNVTIGARCLFHPGAVIGSDGFGNAMTPEGWVKVPQVGGVRIGSDVEIGANTSIDCGAIGDTVIEDGVRIDNLVHIAHNVHIGAHTAIAALCGFAGSTTIGKRCMFAGNSGAVNHITVCDDVIVMSQSVLTKDTTTPGVYSSSFPAKPARAWAKQVARFRRLEGLFARVKRLEK